MTYEECIDTLSGMLNKTKGKTTQSTALLMAITSVELIREFDSEITALVNHKMHEIEERNK